MLIEVSNVVPTTIQNKEIGHIGLVMGMINSSLLHTALKVTVHSQPNVPLVIDNVPESLARFSVSITSEGVCFLRSNQKKIRIGDCFLTASFITSRPFTDVKNPPNLLRKGHKILE